MNKISHNSNFFKALLFVFILTVVMISLIFVIKSVYTTQSVEDFSENTYQYTAYTPTEEVNRTFQNGQWYVENTNLTTWVFFGLDKSQDELNDEENTSSTQTDFILLVIFDEENETYQTVQINRDTMVDIDVLSLDGTEIVGSVFGQITLAHAYGTTLDQSAENSIRAISTLMYDIEIDHYISFSLDIVPAVNDLVGGVEIEVLYDYTAQYPEMEVGATVTLTGEQALAYVQQRYDIGEQTNLERMERQLQYLEALEEIIFQKQTDSSFALDFLLTLSDYIYTDASFSVLNSAVNKYSTYERLENYTIDGESVVGDDFMEFYADDGQLMDLVLELFYAIEETTEEAVDEIE